MSTTAEAMDDNSNNAAVVTMARPPAPPPASVPPPPPLSDGKITVGEDNGGKDTVIAVGADGTGAGAVSSAILLDVVSNSIELQQVAAAEAGTGVGVENAMIETAINKTPATSDGSDHISSIAMEESQQQQHHHQQRQQQSQSTVIISDKIEGFKRVEEYSSVSDSSPSSNSSFSSDDDDDESSSSSSSSSSNNNNIINNNISLDDATPTHMNKSRPTNNYLISDDIGEELGIDDEDEEAVVITKNQILSDDDDIVAEAASMGEAFYSAYDDVVGGRQPSRQQHLPLHQERKQKKKKMILSQLGQDRASVRGMVEQRLKGKTRRTVATNTNMNGVYRADGNDHDPHSFDGNRQPQLHRDDEFSESSGRGERETGCFHPRKRRICYGILAIIMSIVGILLIVYGIDKGEQYIIHTAPSSNDSNGDAPNNSQDSSSSAPPPPGSETLLIVLKESYSYDLFGNDDADLILDNVQNVWLNRDANKNKMSQDQSPQWRVYLHLSDIIFSSSSGGDDGKAMPLHLINDAERLLQLYALGVFYETFNWTTYKEVERSGDYFECSWPGVVCSTVDNGNDGYLPVIALKARGDGSTSTPLLDGILPIELVFLQHLETLDIGFNLIQGGGELLGSIFKQMKNLKELVLNDNRFVSILCAFIWT